MLTFEQVLAGWVQSRIFILASKIIEIQIFIEISMTSLEDIQKFEVLFSEYYNEKKFKEAAYLYTEDGVLMPPEVPTLTGRKGKINLINRVNWTLSRYFCSR